MPRGRVAREWPIDQIRTWIEDEGRTHRWVADQIGTTDQNISKLCAKYAIRVHPRGPRKTGRRPLRDKHGYILIHMPEHPHARKPAGYILEHRLVMERKLGRLLEPHEVVHHLNGVNDDNRPENLEVYSDNATHLREELTGRVPKWTEEGRQRIRAAHVGAKRSDETREKIRAKARERFAIRRASAPGDPGSR